MIIGDSMKKFLLVIMCLLLVGCGAKKSEEIKPGKITCEQMKEIMKGDNNPQLIDVRTEEEYKEYDVWAGDHPDICKRYGAHARYVKPFRYDDLKFISDVER